MSPDMRFMRLALRLARRGYGLTSPNPMVGAVLVKRGKVIGQGWHHAAGLPHAEIEAIRNAQAKGENTRGATLYVTLEPCSTHGRTPPCTEALLSAGIRKVVPGATDPNPKHCGCGFKLLKKAGVIVAPPVLAEECERLNEVFNHWIVHRTPLVTIKAAMTLDGKIATASGESKWITGEQARRYAMRLRQGADAILVGINTVLADDPSLTFRSEGSRSKADAPRLRRIILDSLARTPLTTRVVSDEYAQLTTVVVTDSAPKKRVAALAGKVQVWTLPASIPHPAGTLRSALPWLLSRLGAENVTSLLVEGGGEVNASFLLQGLAGRIEFFYAPKILGGREGRRAVAGEGAVRLDEAVRLSGVRWRRIGPDLLLSARVVKVEV
jgi:diaminohydroxyphosphoribosylaminopyrimidine deaminase / 5-amino-6-(5-phosphoribosylamino)uracil reductase